jgi:hypothetical protein
MLPEAALVDGIVTFVTLLPSLHCYLSDSISNHIIYWGYLQYILERKDQCGIKT